MTDSFFRRVWRWHFWAGLVVCPVLLVVALTGALYTFREEIEDRRDADVRFVEPGGGHRPLSEQLAAVAVARPDWTPTRVTLPADPDKTTVVQVTQPAAVKGSLPAVFVNPHTAAVVADGDVRSPFFSTVLTIHRSLFAGTVGRVAVELTTSWTLVLFVTGVYLWMPKTWGRVGGVWLPRLRAKPYVVLRDLHTVGGLYLAPVAAAIAFTGLFFAVVWLPAFNAVTDGSGNYPKTLLRPPPAVGPPTKLNPAAVDAAVAAARERWPGHTLSVALPKTAADPLMVSARPAAGPSSAGVLTADHTTGCVASETHYDQLTAAERVRLWVLPVHMGTLAGTPTKVLAFVACLVLAGLGLSGIGMWLVRRPDGRWGWPRAADGAVPKPAVVLILAFGVLFPTVGASILIVLVGEWAIGRVRGRRDRTASPAEGRVPATAQTFLLACGLVVGAGCGKPDGRLPVFPVTGAVVGADGKPVAGAAVCFHPAAGDPGEFLRPVGYTKADGTFALTTYTTADGCPAGEFAVTVSLRSAEPDKPEADPGDTVTLTGPVRYADPKTTPLKATVSQAPTALEPFKLPAR